MSRIPYTVNVNEYICDNLEQIRKMLVTHDFSSLPAVVERIQFHASKMEGALYAYEDVKYGITRRANDKEMSDADFREFVNKRVEKWSSND
jgi:hypothetical protein